MGPSFGFNRNETEEHRLSTDELLRLLIDVTSKNGNLLLNVGPTAEGVIPQPQSDRLEEIGRWLAVSGESIYGTKPWKTAESETSDSIPTRYTTRNGNLYAIVLGPVERSRIVLKNLTIEDGSRIHRLDHAEALRWKRAGNDVEIELPPKVATQAAIAFRIAGSY